LFASFGAGTARGRPAEALHSSTRLPALDGIRGIAIAFVVVFHAFLWSGFRPAVPVDRIVAALSKPGWSGVDLFFVLSGFLITGILYDAKGRDGYFRKFYTRRFLRIFPLYYGFLGVFFIVLPWLRPLGRHHSSLSNDQIWYWTYLANLSFALKGLPPVRSLVHFWSLAVEEHFYLVWPWLVFTLDRRALKVACLGIAVGSLGARAAIWAAAPHPTLPAYMLTPARMDALAVGALVALIAREPGGLAGLAKWAPPAAASSAALLGMVCFWRHDLLPTDAVVQTLGFTLLAIFFGSVLAIAVTSPPETLAGRFFAHPGLRFLGRYSYGLYVFHLPIMWYMRDVLNARSVPALAGSQLAGQVLFTAATGSLTLAVAMVSWHFYEARFLKYKDLFA